jgi:hypothetical protein
MTMTSSPLELRPIPYPLQNFEAGARGEIEIEQDQIRCGPVLVWRYCGKIVDGLVAVAGGVDIQSEPGAVDRSTHEKHVVVLILHIQELERARGRRELGAHGSLKRATKAASPRGALSPCRENAALGKWGDGFQSAEGDEGCGKKWGKGVLAHIFSVYSLRSLRRCLISEHA